MKSELFVFVQMVVAIALMVAILMQAKGVGLGRAFGGSGQFYSTKRGLEKILFRVTFVLIAIFIGLSIVNLL